MKTSEMFAHSNKSQYYSSNLESNSVVNRDDSEDYLLKLSVVLAIMKSLGVNGHGVIWDESAGEVVPIKAKGISGWVKVRAITKTVLYFMSLNFFVTLYLIATTLFLFNYLNGGMVFNLILSILMSGISLFIILNNGYCGMTGNYFNSFKGGGLFDLMGVDWSKNLKSQEDKILKMFMCLERVSGSGKRYKSIDDIYNVGRMMEKKIYNKREFLLSILKDEIMLIMSKMKKGGPYYGMVEHEWEKIDAYVNKLLTVENDKKSSDIMDMVMRMNSTGKEH